MNQLLFTCGIYRIRLTTVFHCRCVWSS